MSKAISTRGAVSITCALLIALLTLKLTGLIDLPWVLVLAPILIWYEIAIAALIVAAVLAGAASIKARITR